jgi:phage terminase large subunit GpA-like protein
MRIENLATLPTAERLVTRIVKGFPRGSWEKEPGRRNEALDCRVYARARCVIHGGYMAG